MDRNHSTTVTLIGFLHANTNWPGRYSHVHLHKYTVLSVRAVCRTHNNVCGREQSASMKLNFFAIITLYTFPPEEAELFCFSLTLTNHFHHICIIWILISICNIYITSKCNLSVDKIRNCYDFLLLICQKIKLWIIYHL